MAITLEDDGLTLREFGEGLPTATADPTKGAYILRTEREIEFHFFADDRHSRVVAHRNGANVPYAWRLGRWNGPIALMPLAYFIADDEVLPSDLRTISPATVSLLDRLGSCNHLAGEASSDVSRNQALAEQIAELNCDGLVTEIDALVARLPSQSPLNVYLKNNGPVYR